MSTATANTNPLTAAVTSQQYATALVGPFYAGWAAHFILNGVVCSRLISYTSTGLYQRDSRSTRLILWIVVMIDVVSIVMHGEQFLRLAVSEDRSFAALMLGRTEGRANLLLMAISAALCGSFMSYRAAKLFHSNLTAQSVFVWGMHTLIALGFATEVGAFALLVRQQLAHLNLLTGTWLWINTAVDWILTGTFYLLLKKRFDRGNPSAIKRLVRISIQTASYTSLFTLAGAVVAVTWPTTVIRTRHAVIALELPLTSLYALSLLVTLSSRQEPSAHVVGSIGAVAGVTATKLPRRIGDLDDDDADVDNEDDESSSDGEDEVDGAEKAVAKERRVSSLSGCEGEVRLSYPLDGPRRISFSG